MHTYISIAGLDNSICTYGGMMCFTSGKPLRPLPAPVTPAPSPPGGCIPGGNPQGGSLSHNGSLRVLLINSCVSRNTKAMVSIVKDRINLMPKISSSILESMDRVAKEAAETISKVSNTNNNNNNSSDKIIRHGHHQGLFQKLEVSMRGNNGGGATFKKNIQVQHCKNRVP